MAKVRIELNQKGLREILTSPEVAANIKDRVERIAAAAGEGFEAEVTTGTRRARGSVRTATPEAVRAEATDRTLTRSLDAGR